MAEALIFDAVRTPRGKGRNGALHGVKPVALAAGVLRAIAERSSLDTSAVDDVALGVVSAHGEQGGDIARPALLTAGWDQRASGVQVGRFCASGLEAVNMAAAKVAAGFEDLVVAGGVESMSRVPMGSDGGAWLIDPETNLATGYVPQGVCADLIATLEGFSREAVDAFAVDSHRKAALAAAKGYFEPSLVPVVDRIGRVLLAADETIRPESSPETLAKLPASFAAAGELGFDSVAIDRYPQVERIEHVHGPGNSSQIADGAAAMLIGSAEAGRRHGLTARARIVAAGVVGVGPTIMLTGPAPASRKVLARAGLTARDIDLFEVNEAFAAVVMKFCRDMDVDESRVNVNGGAIALGHPLGATGCMILGTLLDELERREARRGLATLCVGAGMGIATVIERI